MTRISDPHENLPSAQSHSNGKTILLAEDDPFISRMYNTKLTGAGYKVVMANNGRDAYEQIKALNPDLVMLDISMPELTGIEVVKALQSDGSTISSDRLMVLTNSADPNDRKTITDLGVEYLVKAEMTPHEVLNHINQKLGLPIVPTPDLGEGEGVSDPA